MISVNWEFVFLILGFLLLSVLLIVGLVALARLVWTRRSSGEAKPTGHQPGH